MVKVNVEFVEERHFPGLEAATQATMPLMNNRGILKNPI